MEACPAEPGRPRAKNEDQRESWGTSILPQHSKPGGIHIILM